MESLNSRSIISKSTPVFFANEEASIISLAGIYGVLIVKALILSDFRDCARFTRNELSTPPENAITKDPSSFNIESSLISLDSGINFYFSLSLSFAGCCYVIVP
jgi:hypothetical protein